MMKKRMLAIIFMFALCFSLSVPALAAQTEYVIDETGDLTDSEIEALNALAEEFAEATGCDFLYVYTCEEDMDTYVQQMSPGKCENQILMIENDEYWDVYVFGAPESYIDESDMYALRDAFNDGYGMHSAETFSDGIAAYMYAAVNLVRENSRSGSKTDEDTGANHTIILDTPTRMVDMADILNDSQEAALLSKLDELSERQQFDVVIVTVNSLDGKSRMEYADDFFDYNGYGVGDDRDGILYLVNINSDNSYSTGNSWISTTGYGIAAFTDEGIQFIGRQITPELIDGSYNATFEEFIDLADDFITQAKTGEPYDAGNLPRGEFPFRRNLLIALVVGSIVSLIGTGIMKGKLKTIRMQAAASDYIKSDSLNVTDRRDTFLYSHVDRTKRVEDRDSGGSGTHTSSSGSTHGGGGF